VVVRDSLVVSG